MATLSEVSPDGWVTVHPPKRADARRNYDRLLVAAREAVAQHGADAPLDEIARRAGVGSGTLYRHFPTRQALLVAVYDDVVRTLHDHAAALLAGPATTPGEDLAGWLWLLLGHTIDNRGLAASLATALQGEGEDLSWCHGWMYATATELITRAETAGAIRSGVEAADVLKLVNGIAMAVENDPEPHQRGGRMLRIMLDGLSACHPGDLGG